MNEDELTIRLGEDQEFLMTRRNAMLFTFAGELATRNHVFLMTGEETEETMQGMYVFAHAEAFIPLANFMLEHAYPMNLNRNEVADCDEAAFQKSLDQMTGTFDDFEIPDDWSEA